MKSIIIRQFIEFQKKVLKSAGHTLIWLTWASHSHGLAMPTIAQSQEISQEISQETLRVGVYANRPKIFLDDTGQPRGFWIDLIEAIATKEGWTIDYVECEWEDCLRRVERGEIDILPDVAYSEERASHVDFNQEVVLASWSTIYTPLKQPIFSILDLDGQRIGVLRSSIQYTDLAQETYKFGVEPLFIEGDEFSDLFEMLDRGEVDFLLLNRFIGKEAEQERNLISSNILVRPSRLHFIAPRGQSDHILERIDYHLKYLKATPDSAYYEAEEHWLKSSSRSLWIEFRTGVITLMLVLPPMAILLLGLKNRTLQREINRRKQAELRSSETERQLMHSELRFRGIFEQVAVGIVHGTLDGYLEDCNPCFCEMLGYQKEDLIGIHANDITHPDDRIVPDLSRLRSGEISSLRLEQRYLHRDGSIVWSNTTLSLLYDPQGQPLSILTVTINISTHKQAKAALQHIEQRFQNMAENIPGALFRYVQRVDGTTAVIYMNQGCFDLWEVPAEVVSENASCLWEMIHPEDRDRAMASVQQSAQTLQLWSEQLRIIMPASHQTKWIEAAGRPERLETGDVMWDTLMIDVSDRKRAEAALEQHFRREQTLHRVLQTIRQSLDLQTIFETATMETARLLPGLDCTVVVRYLPETGVWRHEVEYRCTPDAPNLLGLEIPDENNPFAERLKRLEIVRVDNTEDVSDLVNQSIAAELPGAWLLIPLVIENRVWGSFSLNVSRYQFRWSEEIIELATAVADQLEIAVQQAELYRRVEADRAKLLENQTVLAQAQEIAAMGNWSLDVASGQMEWSENMFRVFGFDASQPAPNLAAILSGWIHPDDCEVIERELAKAIASKATPEAWHDPHPDQLLELDLRFFHADGLLGYMEVRAEPRQDETGAVVRLVGTSIDITNRKQTELALQASETRYRQVIEAQTDFILRSRADTTITFANPALCKALGTSLDMIIGAKWLDFANPDDLQGSAFYRLHEITPENPRFTIENREQRADGSEGWTQWLNEGIFDELGQLVEIQSVGRDITELKRIEQALRDREERLSLVTQNMSDLVSLHQPDGHYLYATPSSVSLLGYHPDDLIGRDAFELLHPDDRMRVRQDFYQCLLDGRSPVRIVHRIRHRDGHYLWLETVGKTVINPETNQLIHLQATSRDVSDRVAVEDQLKYDALHDALTGLPNRNLLVKRLETAIERVQHHPETPFALLFLDLDRFKVVNDSLGHLVGDQLLIVVADILRSFVRKGDVAARLGGDEFVILLEQVQDVSDAIRVAERVVCSLQVPLRIGDRDVVTGTSIGIVLGTPDRQSTEAVLRDADLAMYRAKRSGRGRYALFDPAMHQQAMERLDIEEDLRHALERQEFVLYYQPIVDLRTREIRGFEALIRWQHPQRGFVSPLDFISIAEETGHIVEIGTWVLNQAVQQLADWQRQFPQRSLHMSVNLSVQQLQLDLLDYLDYCLACHTIAHETLTLELTESMLVQDIEITCNLLEAIRTRGVHLSIDDFGTGYSSLSYLHQLPVDALKIDRAFVSNTAADTRNQVVAESIIALSNLLNLGAIAEGISSEAELVWLRDLGCEFGQGFFFSKPVPADQATTLIAQELHPESPETEFLQSL
jgi:diguanylate cyclase (GGDEF)-like protein/PAS domain S-box-containing protein